MRKYLLFILLLAGYTAVYGQARMLQNPETMDMAERGLDFMYNYEFSDGYLVIEELEQALPIHPVSSFMRALFVYWENVPLTIESSSSLIFLDYLDRSIRLARDMREDNPDDPEGVFFELLGNAMIMMHYADNGKTSRVFPYLKPSYKLLKKGFYLGDQFKEFYFTTGLYNYYIEAYPEAYPVYKPIASLFPAGNKKLGLAMLELVSKESVFLKNEASVFLNHLYLSYENNPAFAQHYLDRLIDDYPNNNFFLIRYVKTLIASGSYSESLDYIEILKERGRQDDFAYMASWIFQGVVDEKVYHDPVSARTKYLQGIKFGKKFGVWVNNYMAIAYAGLSRIYLEEGDKKRSREYLKLAKSKAKYEFVFNTE